MIVINLLHKAIKNKRKKNPLLNSISHDSLYISLLKNFQVMKLKGSLFHLTAWHRADTFTNTDIRNNSTPISTSEWFVSDSDIIQYTETAGKRKKCQNRIEQNRREQNWIQNKARFKVEYHFLRIRSTQQCASQFVLFTLCLAILLKNKTHCLILPI